MTTRPPLIPVEQVDRDAAADLAARSANDAEAWETVDAIRAGERDPSPAVQAFASHRLQARREALEEAAKVADDWTKTEPVSGPHAAMIASVICDTGEKIATAIRTLGES